MSNLNWIIDSYHNEVAKLPKIHSESGGGKVRGKSGNIFEKLIEELCTDNNLKAKKNDRKRTEEINGICLKNLQVDKHIYRGNIMVKAIEAKCYLDSCYFKRALMDFIELNSSPDVPDNVEYAIFAGQIGVSDNSFEYYLSYFKKMTGKDVNVFVVNRIKKRNAKKAIYMKQYNSNFQLDLQEIDRFVDWLKK